MSASAKKRKVESKDRTILINFVLDKSGSMDCIREATISGFNEFKNDQAREEGRAFFTLTLFDTHFETVCAAVPITEVPDLDRTSYTPDGGTALYDAIGHTMRITDDFCAANRPDQVLFVIMTDGEENSSREFTRKSIFSLIQNRQKRFGYEFIYLGANQDSYAVGAQMGVRDGRMLDYAASPDVAHATMRRASHNVRSYRRHGAAQSEQFFSAGMDAVGAIDSEEWKRMTPEEREERLGGQQ